MAEPVSVPVVYPGPIVAWEPAESVHDEVSDSGADDVSDEGLDEPVNNEFRLTRGQLSGFPKPFASIDLLPPVSTDANHIQSHKP